MLALLSVIIGLLGGWYAREIMNHLKALRLQVLALVKRDIPVEEPRKSSMVELPMTPSERVVREQNEMIERLNDGSRLS